MESFSYTILCHHGILGMKWGVRRFQNKDGSLTDAGIKRYEQLFSKNDTEREQRKNFLDVQKNRAGVYSKNGQEFLKKGASIQRIADSNDRIDDRRKYVSILYDDNQKYEEFGREGMLGLKNPNNLKKYTYTAKKDIKIADQEQVSEYILSKYGNDKLKQIYKDDSDRQKLYDLVSSPYFNGLKAKDKKMVLERKAIYDKNFNRINSFMKNALMNDKKISGDIFKEFEKRGYDAIIDVEDSMDVADFPLILLNPRKALR